MSERVSFSSGGDDGREADALSRALCARLDGLGDAERSAGGAGLESRVFASTAGLIRRDGVADGRAVAVDSVEIERRLDVLAGVERSSARAGFEDAVVAGTVCVLISGGGGFGSSSLESRVFGATRGVIAGSAGIADDAPAPIPFAPVADTAGGRWFGWGARLSMAAAVLLTASLTWMMVAQHRLDVGSTDFADGRGSSGGGVVGIVTVADVTFDDLYRFIDDQGSLFGVSLRHDNGGSSAIGGSTNDEWCPLCDWYSPDVEISL